MGLWVDLHVQESPIDGASLCSPAVYGGAGIDFPNRPFLKMWVRLSPSWGGLGWGRNGLLNSRFCEHSLHKFVKVYSSKMNMPVFVKVLRGA